MPTADPRIDAYIAKSADFARPILEHLRAVVHASCLMYKGMLCSMASFKGHCGFGFWQAKKAMKLNDAPLKPPPRAKLAAPRVLVVPGDMQAVLAANARARQHFDSFSPSQQREYTDWIEQAKTATTRQRRLSQAIEWLAQGKRRNWKYENC